MMTTLIAGATFISDYYFDAAQAAADISRFKPTHLLPLFGLVAQKLLEKLDDPNALIDVRVFGLNAPYGGPLLQRW